MLVFFIYAIVLMFLIIFVDWIMRLVILSVVPTMFLTIIFIPFAFANSLSIQVWPIH